LRVARFTDTALTSCQRADLAKYRYDVFVGRLGWDLPCQPGHDQDQFDVPHAVHVLASDDEDQILGYARLLPTTSDYLLGSLFPELLSGHAPPNDPRIWELSRYAATDTRPAASAGTRDDEIVVGKLVLLNAIRTAQQHGAQSLVFCTTVAIERLAMRWGVDIRRLGAPVRSNGQLLVAAIIDFTPRTLAALTGDASAKPAPCINPAAVHAPSELLAA